MSDDYIKDEAWLRHQIKEYSYELVMMEEEVRYLRERRDAYVKELEKLLNPTQEEE
jgi:hypothetical protein